MSRPKRPLDLCLDFQVYGHVADIESEDQTKGLAKFVLEKVKDIHILVISFGALQQRCTNSLGHSPQLNIVRWRFGYNDNIDRL